VSVKLPPPPRAIQELGPDVTKWLWSVFLTMVTRQGLQEAIAQLEAATTVKAGVVKMAVQSADAMPTDVVEGDSSDTEKLATTLNATVTSLNELKQHMRNAGLLENET